jgi:hypothetical protein
MVVMHRSSLWMLGEKEGLSGDLNSRSSGWQSDGRGRTTRRSGSDGDLSSGESELLRKRNPKEVGELIRRWIMRLSMPFIGQRREGRWYREGETVDGEWSYSMLLFWGEERKGQR